MLFWLRIGVRLRSRSLRGALSARYTAGLLLGLARGALKDAQILPFEEDTVGFVSLLVLLVGLAGAQGGAAGDVLLKYVVAVKTLSAKVTLVGPKNKIC